MNRLFDVEPVESEDPSKPISAGRRLTARNAAQIARGVHPATLRPLLGFGTCGECIHHKHLGHHDRSYHKCAEHRLGVTHSGASDIRVSWPACGLFVPASDIK